MAHLRASHTYSHSWLSRIAAEHHVAEEKSITGRLVSEIQIVLFRTIAKHVGGIPKATRRSLHQSYNIFVLWVDGYGVADGDLDDVMSKSSTLRREVVDLLRSISRAVSERLVRGLGVSEEQLDLSALRLVTQEAAFAQQDTAGDDGSSIASDSDSEHEGAKPGNGRHESSSSRRGLDEVARDLQNDVQCLMDLDPLIKAAVPDDAGQLPCPEKTAAAVVGEDPAVAAGSVPLDSAPHIFYADRIAQRFPSAASRLVARLAELNLDRFLRMKAQRETNAHAAEEEEEEEMDGEGNQTTGRSGTDLHDSALGVSLATPSSHAATEMSYRQDDDEGGGRRSVRVLSPPDGSELECVACGRRLQIKSGSAWKRHLFADIRPWACLDLACTAPTTAFPAREDWVAHLAWYHGFAPEWHAIDCPLCAEEVAAGKASILRHLASHLEEISLATLPVYAESDSPEWVEEPVDGDVHDHKSETTIQALEVGGESVTDNTLVKSVVKEATIEIGSLDGVEIPIYGTELPTADQGERLPARPDGTSKDGPSAARIPAAVSVDRAGLSFAVTKKILLGRPCHSCKNQKIPCDRAQPTCNHCKRMQNNCSYPPIPSTFDDQIREGKEYVQRLRMRDIEEQLKTFRANTHQERQSAAHRQLPNMSQPATNSAATAEGLIDGMTLTDDMSTDNSPHDARPQQHQRATALHTAQVATVQEVAVQAGAQRDAARDAAPSPSTSAEMLLSVPPDSVDEIASQRCAKSIGTPPPDADVGAGHGPIKPASATAAVSRAAARRRSVPLVAGERRKPYSAKHDLP